MKILLVYTNINTIHPEDYHFGLASIISYIKRYHEVKLQIIHNKSAINQLMEFIKNYNPEIIGFTSVSSQFYYVNMISNEIKKIFKDVTIVCGGVHPTIYPACILESDSLDGIFIGESEEQFLEFINRFEENNDYRDIDNFAYKDEEGRLKKNKVVLKHSDLNVLPFPERELFDYQKILNDNSKILQVVFSRGCPFNCTYCSNKKIREVYGFSEEHYIRYRSPDNCMEELELLDRNYNFKKIWILDDIFAMNRKWLDEFLCLYSKKFSYPFMCHLRPNIVTEELIKKLKKAGCYRILLSIESGNDFIRNKIMKRNISRKKIIEAFKIIHSCNIESVAPNVIGLPYETEEMIEETIALNAGVGASSIGVSIFYPYKGSELFDLCVKKGWLNADENKEVFEKKESILNYPQISKERIKYYYDNFQYLVYRRISLLRGIKYLLVSNLREKLVFYLKGTYFGKKIIRIIYFLRDGLSK